MDGAMHSAIVPSGASTGIYEACELRDGGLRCMGKGVNIGNRSLVAVKLFASLIFISLLAVENVVGIIAPLIIGKDVTKQAEIDEIMIQADGTPVSH